jgi:hypothetical protein
MSSQTTYRFASLARSAGPERSPFPDGPEVVPAAGELLRQWRAAERDLASLDPASDAWTRLKVEIERLRQRYQDAFNATSNSDPTGSSA